MRQRHTFNEVYEAVTRCLSSCLLPDRTLYESLQNKQRIGVIMIPPYRNRNAQIVLAIAHNLTRIAYYDERA